jgi:glycosyltransferase involved in cell wall biosynthesis
MIRFWRIRNGFSRLRLACARFLRLLKEEIRVTIVDAGRYLALRVGLHAQGKIIANKISLIPRKQPSEQGTMPISPQDRSDSQERPVIFASACVDRKNKGDWKYCGGIKELNILVKLLRMRGYEAYMVTYDGAYEQWLMDHQPHISIKDLRDKLAQLKNVRCVTSWAIAKSFINECKHVYFWDMDLCCTDNAHFSILASLNRNKIKKSASISRTIQAWHMANFGKKCTVIPNLLDESVWYPVESSRKPRRIGYMDEGPHTTEYIAIIKDLLGTRGSELEFHLICGSEEEVLAGMRSCEIFLSMNIGKDPLWGEGCPRTIIEALSVGCVVITFDLIGNREIVIDNYNGFIVTRDRLDLMGQTLKRLLENPVEMQRARNNSLSVLASSHTLEARWPLIKDFLEL